MVLGLISSPARMIPPQEYKHIHFYVKNRVVCPRLNSDVVWDKCCILNLKHTGMVFKLNSGVVRYKFHSLVAREKVWLFS